MSKFSDEDELIDFMCEPTDEVRSAVEALDGEILVLGAGGKMGPTLCKLLVGAGAKRVIAVSRFTDPDQKRYLESCGVSTLTVNLLNPTEFDSLPDSPYVFNLAGYKFGGTGNEDLMWAMNGWLPGLVVQRFPKSKIVYVSSGNVYAYTSIKSIGSDEKAPLAPIGEYAQSRLAGERLSQYWSNIQRTPLTVVRLFYATELRYGIIHDLAWKVFSKEPIDLSMGYVNQIWQGDANAYLCRLFSYCSSPATIINLTGPEILSTRILAQQIGEILGIKPIFINLESKDALLGDASYLFNSMGKPYVSIDEIVRWVSGWISNDGRTLGKPTKYESRSGKF
ncbi:MAG: NAD(P)-dependent oxidoreductase [Candidatus Latescibacterota bacterium]|nr:NAD(P)-dependent oxidoreductase [Candidatus Latescibacterota bacterium]